MMFKDKAVVITGGATGIGYAAAGQLYEEGATVIIIGRREEKLREAQRTITGTATGDRFYWYVCDVSQQDQVADVFRQITRLPVSLYGLVNNAGIPCRKTTLEATSEEMKRTFATNYDGAFYCTRSALEQMLEHGSGSIVNVGSVGALYPFERRTHYNASKAALLASTTSDARDYALQGIRINSVCPGYVRTEMTAPYFDSMPEEEYTALVAKHAMNRLGQPEEIAHAIVFLLSPEASFITGQHLAVDGGWSLGK